LGPTVGPTHARGIKRRQHITLEAITQMYQNQKLLA